MTPIARWEWLWRLPLALAAALAFLVFALLAEAAERPRREMPPPS